MKLDAAGKTLYMGSAQLFGMVTDYMCHEENGYAEFRIQDNDGKTFDVKVFSK